MILQLLLTLGNRAQAGFLSKKLHFEGTPIHNNKSFARLTWKGTVIGVQERTETWSTFATMENQQLDGCFRGHTTNILLLVISL